MVVQHNILGLNANRQLNITTGIKAKSSEKLSSGYRINRAADDAAGLSISEKMRRQIRGLTQASNNCQDGVSWCQIADGALDEVSEMLNRSKELAVKAANGSLTDDDRSYINEEIQKIASEIDRTHETTEFNNINIFDEAGYNPAEEYKAPTVTANNDGTLSVNLVNGNTIEITLGFLDSEGNKIDVAKSKAIGKDTSYADSDFAKFIQSSAAFAVQNLASNFPNLFVRSSSSTVNIGLELGSIDGSGKTLAYAQLSMSTSSTSTLMNYTLKVDSADYSIDGFASMTDAEKADLAGVIAHEMTHLVMYDTLTDGMLGDFPQWFVEGSAQTSSGDNGWVSYSINADSSDDDIKSYMSKLTSMPYGAGYLGTMYLGYAVSAKAGNTNVTSDNIKAGLNTLMTALAEKDASFSDVIGDLTDYYSSASDFVSGFSGADSNSLAFVKALLTARGSGAGSLFSGLSATESDIFSSAGSTGAASNYIVNTDNVKYSNAFGTSYTFPEKEEGIYGEGDGYGKDLYIQAGSENSDIDRILLKRYDIRLNTLAEGKTFNTLTQEKALETLETVNVAAANVSKVRSYYGALQNRLEHTIHNLDNVVENTTAAESHIRDTDMAAEMVKFSNQNILAQAGQSMLAQANQTNQGVLSLLQ